MATLVDHDETELASDVFTLPPLVGGMTPDDLLAWIRSITPGVDALIEGFGMDNVMAVAVAAHTRQRMIALLDGHEQPRTDDEQELAQAAEAGKAISLVPAGLKSPGLVGPTLVKRGETWEVWHAGKQVGKAQASAQAAIASFTEAQKQRMDLRA